MRVLGDQMGNEGEQRLLKGDALIPSFEHLGRHYIITREKEPKRRNWGFEGEGNNSRSNSRCPGISRWSWKWNKMWPLCIQTTRS